MTSFDPAGPRSRAVRIRWYLACLRTDRFKRVTAQSAGYCFMPQSRSSNRNGRRELEVAKSDVEGRDGAQ
jgi:hypothetical protein